jgi:hypothetical protein
VISYNWHQSRLRAGRSVIASMSGDGKKGDGGPAGGSGGEWRD